MPNHWIHKIRSVWQKRENTHGLGELVGGIGGLLLLTFTFTGTVSAFRITQTHQVLQRAAIVALKSEEQNGCWTPETTKAVDTVLVNGGLQPAGAKVTAYTKTATPYGQSVQAGLQYNVGTDVLFGGLGSWTESATQGGNSFNTTIVPDQPASACATPELVPPHPVISQITFEDWTPTGATLIISEKTLGKCQLYTMLQRGKILTTPAILSLFTP